MPHPYFSVKSVGSDGQEGQMIHRETDWELYNLQTDPGEKNNVAKDNPDIVKRLAKMMLEFEKKLLKNKRPAGKY
jgi:hypothetical protein